MYLLNEALLGRKKSATDEPRRVYSEVVALKAHDGAIHGLKGLRRLRHARLGPSEMASLSRATLMEWLLVLQEEPRKWRAAPRDVPPLRAETAPGSAAAGVVAPRCKAAVPAIKILFAKFWKARSRPIFALKYSC